MAKIDEKYHSLLEKILSKGYRYEDPNRKGVHRLQLPSFQIKHDFSDGFPALTTKKLYWKGVIGELIWFLNGDTNIKYLVDNGINIWNKDAYNYLKKGVYRGSYEEFLKLCEDHDYIGLGNLGRIYGAQWRAWKGNIDYWDETSDKYNEYEEIDQFSNLIKGLKETPMGTKHIVTAWNPAELEDMALPPCHWSFEILVEPLTLSQRGSIGNFYLGDTVSHPLCDNMKIPEYQFTLKWHQRSVDTFLGLPFNIASYATLAYIIGEMTNMKPKAIIGDLSNVHIYENHLDAVKEQLKRKTDKFSSPKLNLDLPLQTYNTTGNAGDLINKLDIKQFNLLDYNSYPAIQAEMLSYNK